MASDSKKKWKEFEQLVAAIHFTETKGADVKWNDVINGRQFDVTVRFKHGLHSYLTVIECKDEGKKVQVDQVDAFVTKSRDVNANKAVMVSSRGYQSGCMPVAGKHGIKLLTLSEASPPQFGSLLKEVVPALVVHDVRLIRAEGQPDYVFEEEDNKLQYLMTHTTLKAGQIEVTPEHLLQHWINVGLSEKTKGHKVYLDFGRMFIATVPYEPPLEVRGMRFTIDITELPVIEGPALIPETRYELRNSAGEVEHIVSLKDIEFGFMTKMEPGKFYRSPTLHANYYCDSITGDLMRLVLVESYQHGIKVGAVFTAKLAYQTKYVEITDSKVIDKLKQILAKMNPTLTTQPKV